MFICFEKYSSVINLDLFWKHLFSHTGAQLKSLDDSPYTSLKEKKLKPILLPRKVKFNSATKKSEILSDTKITVNRNLWCFQANLTKEHCYNKVI
jgi:hypothetical protein